MKDREKNTMLSDAMIIYRKEIRNLIKDKRTLFATLILPLLLMPVIFIGMDTVMGRQMDQVREKTYTLVIRNNDDPQLIAVIEQQLFIDIIDEPVVGSLIIEFPNGYSMGDETDVNIYYDSTSQSITFASERLIRALQEYDRILANKKLTEFDLDLESLYTIKTFRVDTAPEESQGTEFLVMMVPYLIIIYTFAGAMSVGIDTTAGEKERGSISIILVNQISRTSIALGKVCYVLSMGVASSIMTFSGLLIAFTATGGLMGESSFSGFAASSLVILLLVLIFTSMLAASIIVLLGSLAKTVKEATSYVMPIYIIVVLLGVLTMSLDPSSKPLLFLIPFLNSIILMKGAILGNATLLQLLLTVISLSVVISLLIIATSKLYNSERILDSAVN